MNSTEITTEGARTPRALGLVQRLFGPRGAVPTVPRIAHDTTGMPASISADAGLLGDTSVTMLAASIRGLSHQTDGSLRQDSYAVTHRNSCIAVAVGDGVGSARLSHLGSQLAVQTAASVAVEQGISASLIATIIAQLRSEAHHVWSAPEELSTTLAILRVEVGAADDAWNVQVAEWGDSRVSRFSRGPGPDGHPNWRHVCPDPPADLANTVRAIPSFATPTTYARGLWLPGELLLVASDGIDAHLKPENLVGHGLAEAWAELPPVYQFIADVGFERAGARDDRTAVCLSRPSSAPPSATR